VAYIARYIAFRNLDATGSRFRISGTHFEKTSALAAQRFGAFLLKTGDGRKGLPSSRRLMA
jgi:hypothetical protein